MILLALLAAAAADTSGPEYRGTDGRTRVAVPRIAAEIILDGVLDDAAWTLAARLTGFSQYAPSDGRAAEHKTEVLVFYSPGAIHFGIRAHAPPGTVRATLADRDKLGDDDRVEIYLDTWNDGRQAMVFGVNPLGVQQDGVLSEGARGGTGASGGREQTDLTPDFVYASRGRLTASGYEVEIRIPFKTLRYQALDPQDWRINVVRRVTATGHEDSWTPARRASPTFLGQSGALVGLTGLRRGLVMDVTPVVTWRAAGAPGVAGGWDYDGKTEFGGSVRWGVTSNLTLTGTANPDFSQVEADASQVITDPRQALFFAEKRPFFLEGIEQFATPNNLVYTRRIVAPVGAAKLTGKANGTNLAMLLAFDDRSTSFDQADPANPFFGIVRLSRDLGSQSRIGAVLTTREDGSRSNRMGGLDTRILLGRVALTAQAAAVLDQAPGTGTVTAPLWQAAVSRNTRRFGLSYTFQGVSPSFRPAAGFVSRAGVTTVGVNHSLFFFGRAGSTVERTTVSFNARGVWDYDEFVSGGPIRDAQFFLTGNAQLRGGWSLNTTLIGERFGYDGRLYTSYAIERHQGPVVDTVPFPRQHNIQNRDVSVTLATPRVGIVSFHVNYIFGKDVNFHEWSPANVRLISASAQVRPTTQLRVDGSFIQQWYQRRTDDTRVAVSNIPRLRLEYQVTRAVFLRLVGEYQSFVRDSLRDDGRTNDPILIAGRDGVYRREPARARNDNALRADLLFSYQPVPGTVFFVGYGGSYVEPERFRFQGLDRTSDGFFVKASYLFRR